MKKMWKGLLRSSDANESSFTRKAVLTASLLTLTAALPAHAVTTSVVSLGDLSNTTLVFPVIKGGTGEFLDIFEFTVVAPGTAFAGAVNAIYDDPAFPGIESNFDIAVVALFDSLFATLAADLDGSDGFSVAGALPAAGLYRFAVLGTANGTVNGSYFSLIQTVVVPEPEVSFLMLTGLGSLALALRRRQSARALGAASVRT